jgi:Zn-dependent metalloprotease
LVGGLAALATAVSGSALVAMATPANAGSLTSPAFGKKPDAVVQQRGNDGTVRVIEAKGGTIARPKGVSAKAKPEQAAKAHLDRFASAFGVSSKELKHKSTVELDNGTAVRFERTHQGIEVIAGEVVVSLDKSNNLEFIVGEVGATPSKPFPKGVLNESKAQAVAKQVVAKREKLSSASGLKAKLEGKAWYDPQVLGVPGQEGVRPVYKLKVTDPSNIELQYQVLVNASTLKVELAYNTVQHAINRVVCDAEGQVVSDYTCGVGLPVTRAEGDGPSSVEDVNAVYDFFYDTSVRFASYVNVDVTQLIGADYGDGRGQALRGTVRICAENQCPFQNAFWDGQQMVFGEGLAADDVTAHELAHGVTQATANLAYLFQSGAINEGLSDFWGEIVDQNNGSDDDTDENRWKIGEGTSIGVIRDMADPTSLGQPDRMTSDLWDDDPALWDNGGVHTNSGVFNKAAYLMVDGGSFNGYDIRGLGPAKSAKIVWTLQNLLAPGADYKDVFYTLPLACRKNIGRAGTFLTEDDCAQVDKVVRATEMYKDPAKGAPKNVDYCDNGTPTSVYRQDFESRNDGWEFEGNWLLSSETGFERLATTGEDSAVAWTVAGDNISLTQQEAVTIPEGAFARFDNMYLLNSGDGAALEYSTDGGATWKPAAELPNVNGEDTPVDSIGGKSFSGNSNGFGGTRYDLSSLAGQDVKFRFRAASVTSDSAWWVDNFKIYTCG